MFATVAIQTPRNSVSGSGIGPADRVTLPAVKEAEHPQRTAKNAKTTKRPEKVDFNALVVSVRFNDHPFNIRMSMLLPGGKATEKYRHPEIICKDLPYITPRSHPTGTLSS